VVAAALAAVALAAGCAGPSVPSTAPSAATGPSIAAQSKEPGESPPPDRSAGTVSLPPTAAGSPDRLLLLAGRPGAMSLEIVDATGAGEAVPLPDPDVAWISTDAAGRALATTRDGRAYASALIAAGRDPSWRRVEPTGFDLATLDTPLAFGTLAPDGTRAAFVAARYGSNGPFRVVVAAIPGGEARAISVDRPAEGAPPVWAGDRLVVLTRERGDASGVTLLDPATGSTTVGPGPAGESWPPAFPGGWTGRIAGLSLSADGATVAVASSTDGPIEVRPAADWLAGRPTDADLVELDPAADGSTSFSWLVASPDNTKLAVVRTDAAGDAAAVEIYAADGGWQRTARVELPPGADRAVVAWLP
jgi:hypothetical protein